MQHFSLPHELAVYQSPDLAEKEGRCLFGLILSSCLVSYYFSVAATLA